MSKEKVKLIKVIEEMEGKEYVSGGVIEEMSKGGTGFGKIYISHILRQYVSPLARATGCMEKSVSRVWFATPLHFTQLVSYKRSQLHLVVPPVLPASPAAVVNGTKSDASPCSVAR
jgi:hypothetical protein